MFQKGEGIFANLGVEENLKVPLERSGPWTIARIYELFPRLAERKLSRGGQLSGGEQEMLSDQRGQPLRGLIENEQSGIEQERSADGCGRYSASFRRCAMRGFRCW